jgi:hypothetical protein
MNMQNETVVKENKNKSINIKKCLQSNFIPKKKPFQSILLCKKKSSKPPQDKNSLYVEPFGPLIVVHKENREKVKPLKKKFRFDDPPNIKYTFFQDHKNCIESEYYWKDIQHPKILRHFSKENKKYS